MLRRKSEEKRSGRDERRPSSGQGRDWQSAHPSAHYLSQGGPARETPWPGGPAAWSMDRPGRVESENACGRRTGTGAGWRRRRANIPRHSGLWRSAASRLPKSKATRISANIITHPGLNCGASQRLVACAAARRSSRAATVLVIE